jgi:hypothetical protein
LRLVSAEQSPRQEDEWRVEVRLEADADGHSLGELLRSLKLDDEARKRLGSDVVVTRDGPQIFLYAWHEPSAREAERVVRELLEREGLAAEVELKRWHPDADEWRPAAEALPSTPEEAAAERERHRAEAEKEAAESGAYDWQVIVHLPDLGAARDFGKRLLERGLPIKRRWRYVLVGVPTEEEAIELGKELEGEAPEGSAVGVRGDPNDISLPGFVLLGSLKPGAMRDLGL